MQERIKYIIFAVLILASLSGCGRTEPDVPAVTDKPEESSALSDTSAALSESAPAAAPKRAETQRLLGQIDEYVQIDAKATLPEKEAYSTYTLKMVDCDPDRLFGIFSPEGYGSYTIEDRNYFCYFESSGKKLVVQDNKISYNAYNIAWGENPMDDVETLMYYFARMHAQSETHDLSFMTTAQMEQFCNDIFLQLGVSFESKLERCVTLTGQEILDFQSELFGASGSNMQMGFTSTSLTEATDTCYLEFSFTYDGLPLLGSEEPGVTSAVNMMPTPSVTAAIMINADGLQSFEMYFPCTAELKSEPQAILSIDEAVAALKGKYDLEIHTSTEVFSGIWLEYIPIVTEDSTILTPYWCFATQSVWEEDPNVISWHSEYANAQRFNAITGKDLTYGG